MLRKLALWLICFGLSFLLSDVFGLTTQVKAFFCIYFGITILEFFFGITYIQFIAIILFATWVATKLFGINFFVAYQIMTFGQCLCTDSKEKDY